MCATLRCRRSWRWCSPSRGGACAGGLIQWGEMSKPQTKRTLEQILTEDRVWTAVEVKTQGLPPSAVGTRKAFSQVDLKLIYAYKQDWTLAELKRYGLPLYWNKGWLERALKGKTQEEVAREAGCSTAVIGQWAKRHGLLPQRARRGTYVGREGEIKSAFKENPGGGHKAVSERLNVPLNKVHQVLRRPKTAERVQVVVRLEDAWLEQMDQRRDEHLRTRTDWVEDALQDYLQGGDRGGLELAEGRKFSKVKLYVDANLLAELKRRGQKQTQTIRAAIAKGLEKKQR